MRIIKVIASATLLSIGFLSGNGVIAGQKQKLPFVGTRSFNFMGGNYTNESITIEKDGTVILKALGNFRGSGSVMYRGKFSNPIRFVDGVQKIYLLKGNKIYRLLKNGQIEKGCWPSAHPLCEAELGD